jgi:hypothetical protein
VKRTLIGGGVAILAAGYLAGLVATGEALFTIGFVVPAGGGLPVARTAVYSGRAIAAGGALLAPRAALPAAALPAPADPPAGQSLAEATSSAAGVGAVASAVQTATACTSGRPDRVVGCTHAVAGLKPER